MKVIFFYFTFIFLILFSCKQNNNNQPIKESLNKSAVNNISLKKEKSCEEIARDIVKSSDLNLVNYKDYFVRIEDIKNDSINIQVYIENNSSDDPKEKQIVESTIAWLLFLPNEHKLWNLTADPDNPVEMKYKLKDFNMIFKSCGIKKQQENENLKTSSINNEECNDISVEMGTGKECIIKNTNINNVYKNLINNKEVEDTNYFLTSIPTKNQNIVINKDGLISIEYQINKNKIKITMSYEGGVTEVSIEKLNNNVKRSIYYSAD